MASALRGEVGAWSLGVDVATLTAFVAHARYHGVLPLLHERLRRASGWPAPVVTACAEAALAQTMWELRHRGVLTEVLAALEADGVVPLVFKGTSLAYTLYPEGELRTRGDTDLLLPPGAERRAFRVLERLGFERGLEVNGESLSYEASFVRVVPGGGKHALDVHWRMNSAEVLADVVTYGELAREARPIPELGTTARGVSGVDALLVACVHRATHDENPYYQGGVAHRGGDRLVWLYDLHLLALALDEGEWSELVRRAETKGIGRVCLDGLERARHRFGTPLPGWAVERLARLGDREPLSRYFAASGLRQQWLNFAAIPGLPKKARFLADAVLPSAAYMRGRYPSGGWLPWLYVKRATGGLRKRLWRPVVED